MPNPPTTPSNVGAILIRVRNQYYLKNQGNLALKNNPKEEIIGCRHLFQ
jgi:hypothetical protein